VQKIKMNAKSRFDLDEFVQKNALVLFMQTVALITLVANLWLASQLSPLAKGIDALAFRVEVLEQHDTQCQVTIQDMAGTKKDIEYIKDTIDRLEAKLGL